MFIRFQVCEPLAKKRYKGKYLSGDLFVIGACYLMDFNGHVTETLRPLDDPGEYKFQWRNPAREYSIDRLVFAVLFVENIIIILTKFELK